MERVSGIKLLLKKFALYRQQNSFGEILHCRSWGVYTCPRILIRMGGGGGESSRSTRKSASMDGHRGSSKQKMVTSTKDFFLLKILTVRPLELYHPKFGKGNHNVIYDGINSSITFSHHFVTLQYFLYSVKHIYTVLFYRTCSQKQEILTHSIFFLFLASGFEL
jgi:hypothetical protein